MGEGQVSERVKQRGSGQVSLLVYAGTKEKGDKGQRDKQAAETSVTGFPSNGQISPILLTLYPVPMH